MKITEVRVIVTCPTRNYVIVKIMTDIPGLYGVGDATLNGRELAVVVRHRSLRVPHVVQRRRVLGSDGGPNGNRHGGGHHV